MHAITVTETGSPSVLDWQERSDAVAASGEVLVRTAFAGVNFIDTYHRSGLYPLPLPFVPGLEGSGRVESLGEGVTEFAVGDLVAWTDVLGSYAELVALPQDRVVAVPPQIGAEVAAASLLQGITAHYLVNDTYPLGPGDRCLVHAGAGGVGRLLIQMAKRIGAEVFATAGGEEKVAVAKAVGADHVIDYTTQSFKDAVEAIAGPRPLNVVFDGVGAATFDAGLDLLEPCGLMVAFGNASGPVPAVDPLRLSQGGSLYLTRPTMGTHIRETARLRQRVGSLFRAITAGDLDVAIGARFPLADAAGAHTALESRATTGKVLLEP
ncbi:MAG: quinone oxidoreductase [Acidimicrobiia bacterium]